VLEKKQPIYPSHCDMDIDDEINCVDFIGVTKEMDDSTTILNIVMVF
jgi:hypothetical protein